MSTSNLIDFFDQHIEATTEFKQHLETLLNSFKEIERRRGPFLLITRAILKIEKVLNIIRATEMLRISN